MSVVEDLKETVLAARKAAQAGRIEKAIDLQETAVTSRAPA
jgi:hypothetical protein